MTKLDYQRHDPHERHVSQRRRMPLAWRRYPIWLGYVSILASVLQVLAYLGMLLFYDFGPDNTDAQNEADTYVILIACMCIAWSAYLFYIGTVMTLGDAAPRSRLLVWGGVQGAASIVLATACAYERLSHAAAGSVWSADFGARVASDVVVIGIPSAAYAIGLLWYELATLTKATDRFAHWR